MTGGFLEEKEGEISDDDSIVSSISTSSLDYSTANWKCATGLSAKRRASLNSDDGYLCAQTPAQQQLRLNNVDMFLGNVLDKFLTPCAASRPTVNEPCSRPTVNEPCKPCRTSIRETTSIPPSRKTKDRRNRKTTGRIFKQIRVKRGDNIGLELCEIARGIYISNVGRGRNTSLKVGQRIIAINDKPCPDTVMLAIKLMAQRSPEDGGYVTLVTGEEHDFAADDDDVSIRSERVYLEI